MNIFDGIILLLLVGAAYRGFRYGLIGSAGNFLVFLAGVWLAGRWYVPFSKILGETLGLKGLFARVFIPFCAGIPVYGGGGGMPFSPVPGFPPSLWEPIQALNSGINGVTVAHLLADSLLKLLAFFLIFVFVSCCLGGLVRILTGILTRAVDLAMLGWINRLGGLAVGFVTGALLVVVAVGMLTPVVFGIALGLPGAESLRLAILNNWQTSVLLPYCTDSWWLMSLVLAHVFKMV